MTVQYQIWENGKKGSSLKFEEWDGVKVENKGLATARSKMKQEKEAQSRFLISFSFFYCQCWIEPDDEFSLICFRPISEKTHTTPLPPILHSVVYRKRPPKTCPTKWNEPPELLATITMPTIQDLDPGYIRMGSHVLYFERTISAWNVTRWAFDIDITNVYPRKTNNSFSTFISSHEISIHRRRKIKV